MLDAPFIAAAAACVYILIERTVFIGVKFRRLQSDKTYKEVLDALLEKYDIDRQTAENDLNNFLSTVRNAGLLDERS